MATNGSEKEITVAEMAKRLKISTVTMLKLAKTKQVPAYLVGKRYRFVASEVLAHLRVHPVQTGAGG